MATRGGRFSRGRARDRCYDGPDFASMDEAGGGGGGGFGPPRGGRGRHPSHLKGRDIGLWYSRKSIGKGRARDRRDRAVVEMDGAREQHITQLLHAVKKEDREEACRDLDAAQAPGTSWRVQPMDSGASLKPLAKVETPDWWDLSDGEEEGDRGQVPPPNEIEEVDEMVGQPLERDHELDERLRQELHKNREGNRDFLKMQEFREKLPAYKMKRDLLALINNHHVVVISGETGCGKTTQVPQFILDDQIERGKGSACRVVCTQPRRISAISVAERVAMERAESCGNGNSTGYQIRLQSRFPRKQGSVLYATTGIVLQWLQTDRLLHGTSHLVLDEVHERSLQSDFLLTIVRDILPHRPDLSIIVMSATLNAQMFSRYFGGCPIIHIPGFTFPVQEYLLEDVLEMTSNQREKVGVKVQRSPGSHENLEVALSLQLMLYCPLQRPQQRSRRNLFMHGQQRRQAEQEMQQEYNQRWPEYLDSLHGKYSMSTVQALEMIDDELIDADLIAALIRHIVLHAEDGAILVFLPGWADISKLHTTLTADQMFSAEHFIIIPLHSLMPTISQTKVFERPPPGVRKIVIATNIAETSITIDDVVHVIDCGKIKETHFDVDNNISTMKPEWVSLANAKQRRGRAGRVQAGFCYHLYNGLRANMLCDYQLPEMLRTPLEELCLQIKILKLGRIEDFIKRTMQPPTEQAVLLAISNLIGLNALSRAEELTALGFHLARLPVEPHIGKLILFGAMFSCLDPVLGIAACLGFKDPFVIPLGKEKLADAKRRELSQNCKSDHLTIVYALQRWEQGRRGHGRSVNDFCWEYFLSQNTLQMLHNMKDQFAEHLQAAGFVDNSNPRDPKANLHSGNEKLVKAVICAGLYPKVAKIRPSFSKKRRGVKVYTKPDGKVSIHPKSVNAEESDFRHQWLVYHLKLKTTNIFLYDCTEVSPYSLLFFGGEISMQRDQDQDTISVDEWIVFRSPFRIASLVKDLRKQLDSLLEQKITRPSPVEWQRESSESALLKAIIDLITTEEGGGGGGGGSGGGFGGPSHRAY